MPTQPKIVRLLAVMGATLLGLSLAGCVLASFSLPAGKVGHNSGAGALNDEEPDVVVYNNVRYVVFAGEEAPGGDFELFIRGFDLNNYPTTPLKQLTFNSGSDYSARIVSGENGSLYIAWAYVSSGNRTVWWLKVRASDLAIEAGPWLLSSAFTSLDNVQIVYSPFYATSAVVWASGNPTSTIYYNRVVSDTTVGTPLIVSQGAGCADASFAQFGPRIVRSYPNGTFTSIAWIGRQDASGASDGVYWREIDNSSGTTFTNCLQPSLNTGFPGGREYDVEISLNRSSDKSFVTWSRDTGGGQFNVILRPISVITSSLCSAYLVSNSDPNVDEIQPSIGAGHVISDWVHLAWQSAGSANAINYELIEASNCNAAPVSVSGVLTLSTAPLTVTDIVAAPQLSVYPGVNSVPLNLSAAALTAEQIRLLIATGQMTPEQAQAALADGTITTREASALAFSPRPNAPASILTAPLAGEDSGVAAPAGGVLPDCEARPDSDKCLALAQRELAPAPAAVSPQAPCGTNAADYVAVSFLDDTNDRMYGWLFGAGEAETGLGCGRGAYLLGGRFAHLARQDTTLPDYSGSYRTLVDPLGFATFVWAGQDSGAPANDEVYLVTSRISVFLPAIQR